MPIRKFFMLKNKKYYIYPTSDGFTILSGTYFKTFSSSDLKNWKDKGVILDLKKDVSWSLRNAWVPSIIEKKIKLGIINTIITTQPDKKLELLLPIIQQDLLKILENL
jgi:hypothetical protein